MLLAYIHTYVHTYIHTYMQVPATTMQGVRHGMMLVGEPLTEPIVFKESGILFEADPIKGQKTGFFLDQRDNRCVKIDMLVRVYA